jgi:hypothetical protein
MEKILNPTTEEIELWSVTQGCLEDMVGYCSHFARKEGVSEEQKAKLADQRGKYHQKAHSLSYDMEANNRILSKYCPISENGCTAEKVMENYITVSGSKDIGGGELPTGVESKESTDVVIYPNPVDDVLYVRYENSALEKVEIFDAKGRLLLQQKITGQLEAIHVSSLPAGVYVLKLTGKNNVKHIKFIKQ